MPSLKIPVSVIVVAKNEVGNLPRCLRALEPFDEVLIVDSNSDDGTIDVANSFGVRTVSFTWNGTYPKKRQWCLDHLDLKHDRVFFVDADEEVTPELCDEISALDWRCAGYFAKGRYVSDGKILRFGLVNNKLCLFDRRKIMFPVVNDLAIPGMGEIEGHYQPVLKDAYAMEKIGQLKASLLHHALEDAARYHSKHEGYAAWEREMRTRSLYPQDPLAARRIMKNIFAVLPKPWAAFMHCYVLKGGFLDGKQGFTMARKRFQYYKQSG